VNDAVRAELEALGVPYEVIAIDPAFSDTAAFCAKYGYPLERTCNTLLVVAKDEPPRYAACAIPAHTRLDVNRRVRKLLGARRASFAPAEAMAAVTRMEVGGVTPIGLPAGVVLYADERLMREAWVILGAGSRDAKIKISPRVFSALGAEIVVDLGIGA
jgi:prolyl-tRNA editing enzyme YbaK/EbsC (Cys-tRNA(Pro) deacylase)